MNRILDVSERDKTCLVEPGVSYFDLYRHLRTNKIPLWIDTADPGWGGLVGNALDRGGGYTDIEFRDHFDAHCGMEVVLPNGEVVRTGHGRQPAGEDLAALQVRHGPVGRRHLLAVELRHRDEDGLLAHGGARGRAAGQRHRAEAPRRRAARRHAAQLDVRAHGPFAGERRSPLMAGNRPGARCGCAARAARRTRTGTGYAASCRARRSGPRSSSTTGRAKVIAAQWQHTKDRLAGIAGVQFRETASYTFPLTDEQVEAVADKARYGIPSLNLFGSRTAPGAPPLEGHLDFSPMIAPHGEELIALADCHRQGLRATRA